LLSDAVRECGFDAVSFKSSLGTGNNLTCFKGDAFEMVARTERVQEVRGLRYEIAELPSQRQKFNKTKYEEDKNDPLSTLIHSMSKPKA
jgi:hypothetical protein